MSVREYLYIDSSNAERLTKRFADKFTIDEDNNCLRTSVNEGFYFGHNTINEKQYFVVTSFNYATVPFDVFRALVAPPKCFDYITYLIEGGTLHKGDYLNWRQIVKNWQYCLDEDID